MITLLYQPGCDAIAAQIKGDLDRAYASRLDMELVRADAPPATPPAPSWDDLLIVVYDAPDFPEAGNEFLKRYRGARPKGLVLPVALSAGYPRPPAAVAEVKALAYDASASGENGRLAKRVGALLGLRLQGRDAKIFISYRALDGAQIASQLYDHLESLGYRAWKDEAIEFDGETKILPGSPVQQQIDDTLAAASLVLLIDTPAAPQSVWIKHEVDTADSLMLPVLPLCFRPTTDPKRGPRFRSLLELQRWVSLELPAPHASLSQVELAEIVSEAERYLCEILRRKCRVPFLVEKAFADHGFSWQEIDKRLLMFESKKQHAPRLVVKIYSHCSIFEQIYAPAVQRFREFIRSRAGANFTLFIYDGEIMAESQLGAFSGAGASDSILFLHHQELIPLISSNFTALGAT
jgi:TIR domain